MEAIEAKAVVRFARISTQKTRLVADMIRGKNVEEAKRTLMFSERKSARTLLKALNSAIANAEVKKVEDPEILKVTKIMVDEGPGTFRRRLHRARGRVNMLDRGMSHITLVVTEDLARKEEAAARLKELEEKRAKKRAAKADTKKAETKPSAKEKKTEEAETKPEAKVKAASKKVTPKSEEKKSKAKPAAKKKAAAKPAAKKKTAAKKKKDEK